MAREAKAHIGIFGRRNYGKSSLINALAGHDVSIVSDTPGTTTDPVKKSIEIPGIGAAVLIDTAGIDDTGDLGAKRIDKSLKTIGIIDLAVLVIAGNQYGDFESGLIERFRKNGVSFFIIHNKQDIEPLDEKLKNLISGKYNVEVFDFSSRTGYNKEKLIQTIQQLLPDTAYKSKSLTAGLISYGDTVLLITPIDAEAPEGRLILPQVQVIRDVLDNDGIAVVLKEREADLYIKKMQPQPKLVVTDSQVFLKADASIPKEIALTSFSILLARQRGDFDNYLKGTPYISKLKDGDKVLILESCTHHVSCDDIGRVKIPRWLTNFTGKNLVFETISGLGSLPDYLKQYALVIQCGGCVLTKKQVMGRVRPFVEAGVPVTNYGMAIAYLHGIYNRAVAPFTKSDNLDYL